MRISATYIERAAIVWGQIILLSYVLVLIIMLFVTDFNIENLDTHFLSGYLIIAPLIILPLFGIVDFLVLYLKFKPKVLYSKNGLYLGNVKIEPEEIKSITPLTYNLGRLDYKLLEFQLKQGNSIYVICKPQFIINYINDKPSISLTLFKKKFPELLNKIKPPIET